jgi:HAD superfamily hydrolase (TIGR01509 family)
MDEVLVNTVDAYLVSWQKAFQIAQIGERKELLFRESVDGNVQILPGVQKWLDKFEELGARQAIASSGPPENIFALVSEVRIEQYFDAWVSGVSMPGKPNLDVFLKAAKEICIAPQNCLVIEDAIAGVDGGKGDGMKCVAVTTTNPKSVLSNADYVFSSLDDMELDHIPLLLNL